MWRETDIRCHVVIQTALSWGPEILVPVPIREGHGSGDKESACNVGDLGSIPGSRRSPRGRNGNPF